jgi:drug/metabolite transporter (DMT)-like permease
LAGAALCAASFLLFLFALRATGAGRITGLRNLSVLFAALWAWRTGEPMSRRGWASALALAIGAVLLAE